MKKLNALARNASKLNIVYIMRKLFLDKDFTDKIIELNTRDQLYRKGINSEGESLGQYSEFTKDIKYDKGQPYDRVTLYDTGEFYKSFRILWGGSDGSLIISANTFKDDTDLIVEWGREILGLTDESLTKLVAMARPKMQMIVRNTLIKQSEA